MSLELTTAYLSLEEFEHLLTTKEPLVLGQDLKERIQACRSYLDQKVAQSAQLIYGINTGFGSLCDTAISHADLEALQRNLVCSHACGMGDEVPQEVVRRMLLLKVLGLSKGASCFSSMSASIQWFISKVVWALLATSHRLHICHFP
jgi:histidine ammonia-lyase